MLQEAGHIKNTAVLIFRHIHCLHLMISEVAWVLVSSGTQVQLQIILDSDYLPHYLSVSYDNAVSKYFKYNWLWFLDDCEILLNNNFIKPNDLLTILNQEFTILMERSTNNLLFLDVIVNKTGTKNWMSIYSKPRYGPFKWNYRSRYLRNFTVCLARWICTLL